MASHRTPKPRRVVVVVDVLDPDNFLTVLAVRHLLLPPCDKLHVVLTGRPVNLGVRSIPPAEFGQRLKAGEEIGALLCRGADETDVPLHAERVLQDGAARLGCFLRKCGVSTSFAIYHGGIAPATPVSHEAHARGFLFDRKDLYDSDAFAPQAMPSASADAMAAAEPGQSVSPSEYYSMLVQLDAMPPEDRAPAILAKLRPYNLHPLSTLLRELGGDPVDVVVGGPATSVDELRRRGLQTHAIHMMGGAWDNGNSSSVNIFANQFNIAADTKAARRLFDDAGVEVRLIPTETCKHPALAMTPESLGAHLKGCANTGAVDATLGLYSLWHAISGRRPFYIFDLSAVISCIQDAAFDMRPVVCSMEGRYFRFKDAGGASNTRMASRNVSDATLRAYYAALHEMFNKV